MKKINKIIIRHIPDYDADTSYLGEFSNTPGKYAVKHNGGSREFPYFNAENVENMKQARQNCAEMMKINDGEIGFIGIKAEAEIVTGNDAQKGYGLTNKISSGGLWGIETPLDGYEKEVEAEQLDELKDLLLEFGFTENEITKAAENYQL